MAVSTGSQETRARWPFRARSGSGYYAHLTTQKKMNTNRL
jgi:hypothetical protein